MTAGLDALVELAAQTGSRLLAIGDIRYHQPGRRRLADVLTAIRLRTTVDALGHAAEVSKSAVAGRWPAGAPPDIASRIAHELRLIGQRGYGTR